MLTDGNAEFGKDFASKQRDDVAQALAAHDWSELLEFLRKDDWKSAYITTALHIVFDNDCVDVSAFSSFRIIYIQPATFSVAAAQITLAKECLQSLATALDNQPAMADKKSDDNDDEDDNADNADGDSSAAANTTPTKVSLIDVCLHLRNHAYETLLQVLARRHAPHQRELLQLYFDTVENDRSAVVHIDSNLVSSSPNSSFCFKKNIALLALSTHCGTVCGVVRCIYRQ